MELPKRPPGDAIGFDPLPVITRPVEPRHQEPSLRVPKGSPITIRSITDLPAAVKPTER